MANFTFSDYTDYSSTITGSEQKELPELFPVNVPYMLSEIFVAVLAVVGNALTLFVFGTDRKLRRLTNYYIASLAMADLLVGVLGVPFAIMTSLGLPRPLWACLLMLSSLMILCTISIFCLVAVSVDRYWAILYPLVYSRVMTGKIARRIIFVCWCAGTIIGLLPVFGWHLDYEGLCFFVHIMDYDYLVFLYFLTIVGPGIIMAVFYAHIYSVVLKQFLILGDAYAQYLAEHFRDSFKKSEVTFKTFLKLQNPTAIQCFSDFLVNFQKNEQLVVLLSAFNNYALRITAHTMKGHLPVTFISSRIVRESTPLDTNHREERYEIKDLKRFMEQAKRIVQQRKLSKRVKIFVVVPACFDLFAALRGMILAEGGIPLTYENCACDPYKSVLTQVTKDMAWQAAFLKDLDDYLSEEEGKADFIHAFSYNFIALHTRVPAVEDNDYGQTSLENVVNGIVSNYAKKISGPMGINPHPKLYMNTLEYWNAYFMQIREMVPSMAPLMPEAKRTTTIATRAQLPCFPTLPSRQFSLTQLNPEPQTRSEFREQHSRGRGQWVSSRCSSPTVSTSIRSSRQSPSLPTTSTVETALSPRSPEERYESMEVQELKDVINYLIAKYERSDNRK